mmetsp:Transcript_94007/g.148620  ORF Transcript_94007/g.148620 Transcript_94007/m.148620 type:complete len:116 (+) Transcript_94007:52-399(+)
MVLLNGTCLCVGSCCCLTQSLQKVASHRDLTRLSEDDSASERSEDRSDLASSASMSMLCHSRGRSGLGKICLGSVSDLASLASDESSSPDEAKEERPARTRRSRRDCFEEDVMHW